MLGVVAVTPVVLSPVVITLVVINPVAITLVVITPIAVTLTVVTPVVLQCLSLRRNRLCSLVAIDAMIHWRVTGGPAIFRLWSQHSAVRSARKNSVKITIN